MENPGTNGGFLQGSTSAGNLDLDPSIHHRHHCADDSDPAGDGNGIGNAGDVADETKNGSPWHRMKWTDEVVRLLIAIVSYIGDDGPTESTDSPAAARRRSSAVLPKKGKWKAVSMLMIQKGCFVSPQQCEDKFNDLNKRYKRLNDILGRGTTCDVVENPSLLDSMTHLSVKAKKDVIKILSSKQLFYREMCAYHNGQKIPNTENLELPSFVPPKVRPLKDGNGNETEEETNDDENEENEDDEERSEENGMMGCENFRIEIDGMINDKTMSVEEKRVFLWKRVLQLGEQRLEIEAEGLELEKQRFKWLRFRAKKEWEMERMRLMNERMMLENQRMAMEARQMELELNSKRPREMMDEEQGGDQMEQGRVQ